MTKDDKNQPVNLDSTKERFFGFLPKENVAKWFILCNLVYIGFCCFVWPILPKRLWFGWWTTHLLAQDCLIATWGAIMWGLYYYKFWPLLDDGYDEIDDEVDK